MPANPRSENGGQGGGGLGDEFRDLLSAGKDLAAAKIQDKASGSLHTGLQGLTERLTDYADSGGNGGGPGLMAAVKGAQGIAEGKSPGRALLGAGGEGLKEKVSGLFGGKGGKGGKGGQSKLKLTNIVESVDVGVPVRVAYNQWTQFGDFPKFMKKVESADNESDEKLNWKAQVFWSHRNWESTIQKQVPDERIVWRSKGEKGHVDGAVTFHELGPQLTRILLVLEYHPQGFFERTGNLWRAQGRRARLELKHFQRHVMTQVALNPDEIEGWRGVIEDGEVVKDHETAVKEEEEQQRQESGENGEQEPPEDRAEEEEPPEDEAGEEEPPEDRAEEEEPPEDLADEEEPPEDEAGEEEPDEGEPPEDEADADQEEAGADEEEAGEEEPEPVGATAGRQPQRSQARPARSGRRASGGRDRQSSRPASSRARRGTA